MSAQRRRLRRPRRGAALQTVEQPVYNAGENYAASTAATAGVAIVRDARTQPEAPAPTDAALDRDEPREMASTLAMVLGLFGFLVALTAVGQG